MVGKISKISPAGKGITASPNEYGEGASEIRRKNSILPFMRSLSIIDLLNLSFLGIMVIFFAVSFRKIPNKVLILVIYSLLFLFVIFVSWIRETNLCGRWQPLIMFIYPAVFLFTIFETFFLILPFFNGSRFDALMAKIDFVLLGVHPTVWIENWIHPFLTETLYVFYFLYFPMPLIILGWMLRKAKFKEIASCFFCYLICYYGAYIVYFFIPVQGPRFHLFELHQVALTGYFLAEPIRKLIDFLEPNKLDAFPSLHAAILALTMMITYRYNKKMFYWFIPCAVGITISLVYLRYHFFIDLVAGFFWAFVSYPISVIIYNRYHHKLRFHFNLES